MNNFFQTMDAIEYRRIVPAVLLVVAVIAYGMFFWQMGFYWDDLPISWIKYQLGAEALKRYFSEVRPLWAMLYQLTTSILPQQPVYWQLFAITLRWLTAVVFWAVMVQSFPRRQTLALALSLLMLVYPGFNQHWVSFLYSHFFIVFLCLLLSWYWMLRQKILLALLFSALNLWMLEYFFFLELARRYPEFTPSMLGRVVIQHSRAGDVSGPVENMSSESAFFAMETLLQRRHDDPGAVSVVRCDADPKAHHTATAAPPAKRRWTGWLLLAPAVAAIGVVTWWRVTPEPTRVEPRTEPQAQVPSPPPPPPPRKPEMTLKGIVLETFGDYVAYIEIDKAKPVPVRKGDKTEENIEVVDVTDRKVVLKWNNEIINLSVDKVRTITNPRGTR